MKRKVLLVLAYLLSIGILVFSQSTIIKDAYTPNRYAVVNSSGELKTNPTGLSQGVILSGQKGFLAQTATTVAAPTYVTSTVNPLSTDTSGNLRIAGTVTSSGTVTTLQGSKFTLYNSSGTEITFNADETEGSAAGTSGSPTVGKAATVERTAVDNGDTIRFTVDPTGAQVTRPSALLADCFEYVTPTIATTDEVTVKAGEANYYLCITSLFVQNSGATATKFQFTEGASGTVRFAGYAGATGGGFARGDGSAPVTCTQTAGVGFFAAAGTTAADLNVHVRGFRTKVKPVITP